MPVVNEDTPSEADRVLLRRLVLAVILKLALLVGIFFLIKGTVTHVDTAGMAIHIGG